jgi:hypothetical protein
MEFAVLISSVVCDAFDIWMGWLSTLCIRRRAAGPSADRRGWHWATIACRVTVRSPRWAFPPRLPGGPTAAGHFFAILNYQEDRWQCLPADSATSMQLGIREPIGSSLGESSIRARWVYGEPATRCGGFDGRALFR